MTTSSTAVPRRFPGRLLVVAALALATLGVIGFVVQIAVHPVLAPWYLPISASVGVVLLVVSLIRKRTAFRVLALVMMVLLAGVEWAMMWGTRLPAYTGPVARGNAFPEFSTKRPDGTAFTQHDLKGEQDNVLVFFRGRW
jgi:hypothetical protein